MTVGGGGGGGGGCFEGVALGENSEWAEGGKVMQYKLNSLSSRGAQLVGGNSTTGHEQPLPARFVLTTLLHFHNSK